MIPRIGASVTFYGLAVLRQFEVMGIYPLNESVAIGRSRDKLRCLQLLARRGIGLPVTAYTHDPRQAEDIIDLVGGAPVIIKLLEGTQGIGVVLGDTMKSAKSVIEAFQGANVDILVQEFIKEADSTDIRALVIGDKVVAAMKRAGAARRVPLQSASRRLWREGAHHARKSAARRSGRRARSASMSAASTCCAPRTGRWCSRSIPRPGIEGLEKATGVDVAGLMIEFLERNAAPGQHAHQGQGLSGGPLTSPWQIAQDAAGEPLRTRIFVLKFGTHIREH